MTRITPSAARAARPSDRLNAQPSPGTTSPSGPESQPRINSAHFNDSLNDVEILDAARNEIQDLAVATAVFTSLLNHLQRCGATGLTDQSGTYLPADPVVLPILSKLLDEPAQYASIIEDLALLLPALREAKSSVRQSLKQGPSFLTHLEMTRLTQRWRLICHRLIVLIEELEHANSFSPFAAPMNVKQLAKALMESRDANAVFYPTKAQMFPEWAQRRRERRVSVRAAATAVIGGRAVPVLVIDASAGGLGLELPDVVFSGDRIDITLACGRIFSGQIVWRSGPRAGMLFDDRLAQDDVLLAAN